MNAKTDGWESYTDAVGRRHWRWPAAAERQLKADGAAPEHGPRKKIGLPEPAPAGLSPWRPAGK
jgi:hypothetical protein